jgi:hypothetical protein
VNEDPSVPPLSVERAASRLGMSRWGLYKLIDRGELQPVVREPIGLSVSDVEALRARRQDAAIGRIGPDRVLQLARDVRLQLHPPATAPGSRGHAALENLSETVKSAFSMPLLHGASMPDGAGCRWCAAVVAGKMLGVSVRDAQMASEVGLALLGGPECERHQGLVRARMAELTARVHPGGVRPSAARTEAPQPPAAPAPRESAQRPVTAAAKPVQDDGGKSMVARRLREVRARQKDARRRGDQAYALRMAQMARDLEADAAVVDGRVTAAARPGRLKCGHLVSAGCVCARRASKPGQR